MKLRNIKIDESIKKQFEKALEDEHTVLNTTEADALVNEKDRKEQIENEFKENDKVAEEVAKATAGDQAIKVKTRKDLTKLLSENQNKKAKISRCLEEGYRYLVEWIEEIEMERDGEEDNTYLVIEGAREGYSIDQVEGDTITVKELKEILDDYDDNIKVVIGNDFRSDSYYTYGAVNEDNMKEITITEPEEEEEEIEEEETNESLKKDEIKKSLKEEFYNDDEEQSCQMIVCGLYSKYSNTSRKTIYDLVANIKSDYNLDWDKDYDVIKEKADVSLAKGTYNDYLDTGNTSYLEGDVEESLKESKETLTEKTNYEKIMDLLNNVDAKEESLTESKKDKKIKAWVREFSPSEFQLDRIKPDLTFEELYELMSKGEDVYEVASVDGEGFDSDVREKIFIGMEETLGKDYEEIYQMWLHSDELKEKNKLIETPKETTEEEVEEAVEKETPVEETKVEDEEVVEEKLDNNLDEKLFITEDAFNNDELEGLEGISSLINKRKGE